MKKQLNHRIWDFLEKNPNSKTSVVAKGVNYDSKLVGSALSNMTKLNQVTRTGTRSDYKYSAANRPPKRTRETPEIRFSNMRVIFSDVYHHPVSSTRDLSSRVSISYNTVRKCIRELERVGALMVSGKDNLGATTYIAILDKGYFPYKNNRDSNVLDRIKQHGGGVFGSMAAQLA